jgi:hypothetical protein
MLLIYLEDYWLFLWKSKILVGDFDWFFGVTILNSTGFPGMETCGNLD